MLRPAVYEGGSDAPCSCTTNSLKRGPEKSTRFSCAAMFESGDGVIGFQKVLFADFPQALRPDRRQIDRGHQGAQRLVRADVRRRLFPADVLFAGGKRQHKARRFLNCPFPCRPDGRASGARTSREWREIQHEVRRNSAERPATGLRPRQCAVRVSASCRRLQDSERQRSQTLTMTSAP